MNPEVQNLIQRALAKDIPLDVFYARMGQLGIPVNDAQTILSNAAGGTPQGIDPSLSVEQQPLGEADRVMAARIAEPATRPMPAAPQRAAPQRPAPMTDEQRYSGMTPAEAAVAKAQDLSSRRFWQNMRGAPEVPVDQRRPSYQTLAGLGARSQAVDPEKAAAADTALNIALQRTMPQTAVASGQTTGPAMGPEVSPEMGSPFVGSPMAADAGSPYVGSPYSQAGDAQRFRPMYDAGQAQRFRPAGETIQRAIDVARTSNAPAQQAASTQESPSLLAQIIRGRFGEAGKGSPMDDRLTAAQEARDRMESGMAKGGSVEVKPSKGDALHKALEIIHHLITTR